MRMLGAVAGLTPAAMALGIVTGLAVLGAASFGAGTTAFDLAIGASAIVAFAVAVGWLVEPSTRDSIADDVAAGVSYVVTACLLFLVIATIGMVGTDVTAGRVSDPVETVLAGAAEFAYGLLYSPVLALVVAPFSIGWVVTVRRLERRSSP
jgi:hypothetical protein